MEIQTTRSFSFGGNYDVIVCGGGPAGVCAAISAARAGVKTLLIERNGMLGGFWVSGLLTWIGDICDKRGLVREIICRMKNEADGRVDFRGEPYFTADTERTKLLFERMCIEAGVELRYYTFVTGAIKDGTRVKAVTTESKSGAQYFEGKIIIDATGDGDVGAAAGCEFEFGNENGETQPASLIVQLAGIRDKDIRELYKENCHLNTNDCILKELERAGVSPSYIHPLLAPVSVENNLFSFMVNHEYKVSALSAKQLTQATIHARAEIFSYIQALKKLGGIWKDVYMVSSASNIGVREARRIVGKYRLTLEEDLLKGTKHYDGICEVGYNMDIHQLSHGAPEDAHRKEGCQEQPYEIPLRALIARDTEGLMMAGRCISGDVYAHSNFRIGGNAAKSGEAAGTAAAFSILNKIKPENVGANIKLLLAQHDKFTV